MTNITRYLNLAIVTLTLSACGGGGSNGGSAGYSCSDLSGYWANVDNDEIMAISSACALGSDFDNVSDCMAFGSIDIQGSTVNAGYTETSGTCPSQVTNAIGIVLNCTFAVQPGVSFSWDCGAGASNYVYIQGI